MQDLPSPEEMAARIYDLMIYNKTSLYGPWKGWRLAGRDLVSPDGLRVNPERLKGLVWRQEAELRREATRARKAQKERSSGATVKVLVVDLGDWKDRHFGRRAG